MDNTLIDQGNNTMDTPDLLQRQLIQQAHDLERRLDDIDEQGHVIAEELSTAGKDDSFTLLGVRDGVSVDTDHTRKKLQEVKKTLDRIKKGRYGICERCGKKIDQARLKVLATATHCRDCK